MIFLWFYLDKFDNNIRCCYYTINVFYYFFIHFTTKINEEKHHAEFIVTRMILVIIGHLNDIFITFYVLFIIFTYFKSIPDRLK